MYTDQYIAMDENGVYNGNLNSGSEDFYSPSYHNMTFPPIDTNLGGLAGFDTGSFSASDWSNLAIAPINFQAGTFENINYAAIEVAQPIYTPRTVKNDIYLEPTVLPTVIETDYAAQQYMPSYNEAPIIINTFYTSLSESLANVTTPSFLPIPSVLIAPTNPAPLYTTLTTPTPTPILPTISNTPFTPVNNPLMQNIGVQLPINTPINTVNLNSFSTPKAVNKSNNVLLYIGGAIAAVVGYNYFSSNKKTFVKASI